MPPFANLTAFVRFTAILCLTLTLVPADSTRQTSAIRFGDFPGADVEHMDRQDRPCCGLSANGHSRDVNRGSREIPLNVIRELNQVSNVSDLFRKFMPDVDLHEAQHLVATTSGVQTRTALNLERRSNLVPKASGCTPEYRSVNLKDNDDPSLYYYPPCTRVNRCGGCCAHDLLACQPIKAEMLNFEVMVSQYNEEGKLEYKGRKAITVEQHLKCKCDCIVKEKDCNHLQVYHPNECRCVCSNDEDQDKCNAEQDIKLWNPSTCSCQCRDVQECTSGFLFDYNSCRCEPTLRTKQRNPAYDSFNRNRYNIGQS
ncbi:platelet-derived growth factor subunit A-like [Daktulosphaira vitifoliae]|uniref:platelet-derived growth factor subunit A-like n=1 Tax=Daktulosphaira vitifoliae TaxID=58002 RepID=UPI0021A98763|nr:platelet-derived growth factor subunit A-like [Daktulosphaira vitifoliae]